MRTYGWTYIIPVEIGQLVYMCVCMHVCVWICVRMCIWICVCIMCVCMCVWVACVYAFVCVSEFVVCLSLCVNMCMYMFIIKMSFCSLLPFCLLSWGDVIWQPLQNVPPSWIYKSPYLQEITVLSLQISQSMIMCYKSEKSIIRTTIYFSVFNNLVFFLSALIIFILSLMNLKWWYLEKQRAESQGKWERETVEEWLLWRRFENYDSPLWKVLLGTWDIGLSATNCWSWWLGNLIPGMCPKG